jgi:hypothetical protein
MPVFLFQVQQRTRVRLSFRASSSARASDKTTSAGVYRIMNRIKKRIAFRPSVSESQLEERWVPSTAGAVDAASTTTSASAVATPLAAPPPVSSSLVIGSASSWTNVRQLRAAYAREAKLAALDLRNGVADQVQQLFANGSAPTAQQLTNLSANIQGALDATALQLSSQASLLPASSARLVPKIQTSLLGAGSKSLSSELSSVLQSSRNTASALTLQKALGRIIAQTPGQITGQFNNFFATTPVNQLSVNSTGQQIPLRQFMGQQLVSQLGNTLGSLAQSFPGVANSVLFPNGVSGSSSPTQALTNQFGTMASNALSTAALQLGSDLSLFGGNSNVASQLQPLLFGTGASAGTSISSLASALQSNALGSTGVDTSAIANAFNTGFSNLLNPINSFLGLQTQSNSTLPTSGFTSPFGSQFTASNFNSGFNNGFATGTNSGFVGFGVAPTSVFNTNFGTGFNQMVSTLTQNVGLGINGMNTTNETIGINGGTTGTTTGTGGSTGGSTGTTTGTTGTTGSTGTTTT